MSRGRWEGGGGKRKRARDKTSIRNATSMHSESTRLPVGVLSITILLGDAHLTPCAVWHVNDSATLQPFAIVRAARSRRPSVSRAALLRAPRAVGIHIQHRCFTRPQHKPHTSVDKDKTAGFFIYVCLSGEKSSRKFTNARETYNHPLSFLSEKRRQ